MRVPILLVLPAEEQLRNLSLYRKGLLAGQNLPQLLSAVRDKFNIPSSVSLARDSYAIPLRIGKSNIADKRTLDWSAETFALRVFV